MLFNFVIFEWSNVWLVLALSIQIGYNLDLFKFLILKKHFKLQKFFLWLYPFRELFFHVQQEKEESNVSTIQRTVIMETSRSILKEKKKTPYPENADINQEKEIEIRKIIRT